MKTYLVTITATVTKTYEVEAETEDQAVEYAHDIFTVANGDVPEHYSETTDRVEEVK